MTDELELSFVDNYLRSSNGDLNIWGKIIYVLIIVIVAKILIMIAKKLLNRSVSNKIVGNKRNYNRILTVTRLLERVITIMIFFFAATMVLDIFGINTNSIIATIGIGSLALSFGAQSLVKDFINGIFLITEDQYRVGDLVEIASIEGYVELLGIRTTQIRDFSGNIHTIPNGEINIITNKSRGNMRARVNMALDISENPQDVINALREKLAYLKDDKRLVKDIDIWGVSKNLENGYEITVCGFTRPGDQYDLEYELRQKVVELINQKDLKTPKIRTEVEDASI